MKLLCSLSVLQMHAMLINLCFIALVVGALSQLKKIFHLEASILAAAPAGVKQAWCYYYLCFNELMTSSVSLQPSDVPTQPGTDSKYRFTIKLKHCFILVARCFIWDLAAVVWTQISLFQYPLTVSEHPGTHEESQLLIHECKEMHFGTLSVQSAAKDEKK